MSPDGRRRMRGESGYVLAMIGMLIIPLLAFTAFAVDLGSWYAPGVARMQRAADAAALAGVVWANDPIAADQVGHGRQGRGHQQRLHRRRQRRHRRRRRRSPRTRSRSRSRRTASSTSASSSCRTARRLTRSPPPSTTSPSPSGAPATTSARPSWARAPAPTPERASPRRSTATAPTRSRATREASTYFNLGTSTGSPACNGTANGDYSANNYEYYIELPAGRTQAGRRAAVRSRSTTPACRSVRSPRTSILEASPRAAMSTTFTLFKADGTPLDDTDNPTMASQTAGNGCASTTAGINGTNTFAAGSHLDVELELRVQPERRQLHHPVDHGGDLGLVAALPDPDRRLRPASTSCGSRTGGGITGHGVEQLLRRWPATPPRRCATPRPTPRARRSTARTTSRCEPIGTSATSDFYLAEIDASNVGKTLIGHPVGPG